MPDKDSRAQNNLFPVFLKLESLNTLVIGGGNVALEKLTAVFQNSPEARVKLVAKEINPQVRSFIKDKGITFSERSFVPDDLNDTDLVIIAINDKNASKEIHEICKKKRILANVADTPEYCDFYLASIMQKGNLKIAVSTNGKSPTIGKRIRDVLAEAFPDEIDEVLDHMENIRNELKGNFSEKVRTLNKVTEGLAKKDKPKVLNK